MSERRRRMNSEAADNLRRLAALAIITLGVVGGGLALVAMLATGIQAN